MHPSKLLVKYTLLAHNDGDIHVLIKLYRYEILGRLIIADTGNSISESVIDNIFNPFVCGDNSRKNDEHSGLGLSITQKIIEKHSGEVKVIQPYDEYTKAFIIILPCIN